MKLRNTKEWRAEIDKTTAEFIGTASGFDTTGMQNPDENWFSRNIVKIFVWFFWLGWLGIGIWIKSEAMILIFIFIWGVQFIKFGYVKAKSKYKDWKEKKKLI